jgi:hypothetical protein
MDSETIRLLKILDVQPATNFTTAELSEQTGIGHQKIVDLLRASKCAHEMPSDSSKTLNPARWKIRRYVPGVKKPWE